MEMAHTLAYCLFSIAGEACDLEDLNIENAFWRGEWCEIENSTPMQHLLTGEIGN